MKVPTVTGPMRACGKCDRIVGIDDAWWSYVHGWLCPGCVMQLLILPHRRPDGIYPVISLGHRKCALSAEMGQNSGLFGTRKSP